MPMREECKNFESRTYANGETVRKCNLDLAPDAPWRCPDRLPGVRAPPGRRQLDPRHAGHAAHARPSRPALDDGSAAAVLDEAEDIINCGRPGDPGRGRRPSKPRQGFCQARCSAASASHDPSRARCDRSRTRCEDDHPVSTFTSDAAARWLAPPGCTINVWQPSSGSRPRAALHRGGDLALQPHRRARPGPLRARPTSRC